MIIYDIPGSIYDMYMCIYIYILIYIYTYTKMGFFEPCLELLAITLPTFKVQASLKLSPWPPSLGNP